MDAAAAESCKCSKPNCSNLTFNHEEKHGVLTCDITHCNDEPSSKVTNFERKTVIFPTCKCTFDAGQKRISKLCQYCQSVEHCADMVFFRCSRRR
jgi:hypothetical protein